MEGTVFAFL